MRLALLPVLDNDWSDAYVEQEALQPLEWTGNRSVGFGSLTLVSLRSGGVVVWEGAPCLSCEGQSG